MQKILVANRGEIALRIMHTLREMGIRTVAVFSEPDRTAPHVLFADEAVCIGGGPSAESYLDGEKIIELAIGLKVEGIHPGYGFLSEHAGFAQAVTDAGMVFIGPGAAAMRIMGSKLAAKECVAKYGIPMIPGIEKAIDDIPGAKKIAAAIGYPILIKASAGGGGKGMRVVNAEAEFEEQLQRATSEATAAFGDGAVFIEKYVASPRHIEVQVLADQHGNVVHLFERECSIQRRHQKVVEESPSTFLTPALRQQMGEAAVMVAKSCNYVSTGTVEFLMDGEMNFYFLEMNTRLQVEHPVTEMITGIDLVAAQVRIARGEPLGFTQQDISINGHAIELRVYAEDPLNDFLPSIGTLSTYQKPTGPGIRIDDGYQKGMTIPIYYDPLIAKLVAHGKDRATAIQRMKTAIDNFIVEGPSTTLPFGKFVMNHPAFIAGDITTHFVKDHFSAAKFKEQQSADARLAALIALKQWKAGLQKIRGASSTPTNWKHRQKN